MMAMACVPPPNAIPCFTRRGLTRAGRVQLTRLITSKSSKMKTSIVRGEANSTIKSLEEGTIDKRSYTPPPEKYVVVGCGAISIDYLASVARFPQPDEKIRSMDFKVQGGGNAGNCLTAVARLGLRPRILSKVAEDAFGKLVIDELKVDGIDTSFIVVSKIGTTSFTYVIVDRETNTRTCINSPGNPPLDPQELPTGTLAQILDGASILYLDGRLADTALLVAKEAKHKSIPVLVDAERKREGLDDLLALAEYVVCSSKFPQAWTEASTLPEALVEIALRLPDLKFVIVTLGASGCVMLEKSFADTSDLEIVNANTTYELLLEEREHRKACKPFAVSSKVALFRQSTTDGESAKEFTGRFLIGTAEMIPSSELVDTTGSGDAFIGAVLYSLCAGMPPEEMLSFGAIVAGANCRALGARAGLPYRQDPKLIPFLGLPVV